jgi:hypothetical protein
MLQVQSHFQLPADTGPFKRRTTMMIDIPFCNEEGLPDPTAYYAMINYERDRIKKEMKAMKAEKIARKSKPVPDKPAP